MQFYLTSLQGKEYFAKEPEPVGVFDPLEPESLEKIPGAGAVAAWEKNQEPEPFEKKSGAGAGAAKKFAGSPTLFKSIGEIGYFDFPIFHQLQNSISHSDVAQTFIFSN